MVQRRSSTGTLRSGVGAARYRTRYGWPQSHTPGNPSALRVAPQPEHSRDQGRVTVFTPQLPGTEDEVGAQHAAPLRDGSLEPQTHTRACNRSRIRSASLVENPGSDAISAGVAVFTPASEPNRSSSARRRPGPTPGIASSSDVMVRRARRWRL